MSQSNVAFLGGKLYAIGGRCVVFRDKIYAIANSTIYSFDAADTSWKQEHIIYDDKQIRDNLGLTITIGNQQGAHSLVVIGADRDIWTSDGKTWNDAKAIKTCTCDMKIILCKGCQCGGA